jgi:GDP-mannose transporter
MALGAILAGANDLQYSTIGYFWMMVNCLCTSSYTLCMRYVGSNIQLPRYGFIDVIACPSTISLFRLFCRFGMVFYNNLLSIMFLFPCCILKGEYTMWFNQEMLSVKFILLNILAGLFGCGLNFASLWCVTATSATTYAIIGSVNKVPITMLGFIFYRVRLTNEGIIFVVMATLGGFIYAYSKLPGRS